MAAEGAPKCTLICGFSDKPLESQALKYRFVGDSPASKNSGEPRETAKPVLFGAVAFAAGPSRELPALARGLPAALAQTHLFGQFRARLGIVGRNHWVILGQTPFGPIVLGAYVVLGSKVPFE